MRIATYVINKIQGRSDYLIDHARNAVDITVNQAGEPEILVVFPWGEECKADVEDEYER